MDSKLHIFAKYQKHLQILAKHQNTLCSGPADEPRGGTIRTQDTYQYQSLFQVTYLNNK